jgi:type IV fimbrial biogenesis protein FimT
LLVVVAISGILAAVVAPSLVSVIESNRRSTISNQLMEDLVFARRQAIALSSSVALCGSDSTTGNTCIAKGPSSADWSNGWYTYIGSSNKLTPASAAAGLVLRSPQALPSGWKVDAYLSDPGTYVYVDALSTTNKFGHFTIYRLGSTSGTTACVTIDDVGRARAWTSTSSNSDPCSSK